jgi:hypothetical protein
MRPIKPALQSSKGRSKPWGGARLVNAFAEMSEGDKAEDFAVLPIPGFEPFSAISSANPGDCVRGQHVIGSTLYAVIAQTLYSVASDGARTALGTILGSDPVRMADNGTELAIVGGVSNTTGYVLSGGTVSTPANLPAVNDVTFVDGYFLWTAAESDQYVISGLNDGLTYDPLDVGSAEGSPDALVGVLNNHRDVLLFGTASIEVHYDSGAADFPFERQGNAFVERGCADRDSIQKLDNSALFVGNDRIVYRLNGYSPLRISTHGIEQQLARASWFRAFTYELEGHSFYVLNTDVGSFAYDAATGAWADRQSYGLANYRIGSAATAYGKLLFGDNRSPKIHAASVDLFDEAGDPLRVIVELPPIGEGRERLTLYAIELFCETGTGNSAAPDPQAIMQYSRDGGRTWSNELWRTLGRVGEYPTRAVWRSTVEFRQLQIRFVLPAATKRTVLGYYADVR